MSGPSLKQQAAWVVPAILIGCSGVSILTTDLYTPSLPHLPDEFSSDPKTVQLTMSLNILAYALAQLFHGPLSDRIGHRKLLAASMFSVVFISIACALSLSIEALIGGRIVQGFASSVPSVVVILIIRSLYSRQDSIQLMSIYGMVVGLVPAVGPMIGGYVHVWFGWEMNFYLLAFLALIMSALAWKFLPDTGYPDPNALKFKKIASGYGRLLLNGRYLRYLLVMACATGALYTYLTAGTFVIIERLGVPTENFGFAHGTMVLAYMVGSMGAGRVAKKLDAHPILSLGITGCMLGGIGLFIPVYLGVEDLYYIIGGMMVFAFGLGFVYASGPICATDAAGDGQRSSASALLGSIQMGGGALGGLLVGFLYDGTALPMVMVMLGLTATGAIGYLILGQFTKKEEKPEHV